MNRKKVFMYDTILFPSDVFNNRKVDAELENEYFAAKEAGFKIVLFSYVSWFEEEIIKLNSYPEKITYAIYRGWMMSADKYKKFYNVLADRNIYLKNDPKEYENCHYYPNSYPFLEGDTSRMLLYPLYEKIDINEVLQHFPKFMVKDYVKSVKGSNFPKYFDSSYSQEEFDYWMSEFYKFRGNLISGGICIKEYLNLKKYVNKTNECRVFYYEKQALLVEQDCDKPKLPIEMIDKYTCLHSNFYTVDYAEMEDNTWRVIECGDGQVSGILSKENVVKFYEYLYCLEKK